MNEFAEDILIWWKEFFQGYTPEYKKYFDTEGYVSFKPNVEIIGLKFLSLHYILGRVSQDVKHGYKGVQTAHSIRIDITQFNAVAYEIALSLETLISVSLPSHRADEWMWLSDKIGGVKKARFATLEYSSDFEDYSITIDDSSFNPIAYMEKGRKIVGELINESFKIFNEEAGRREKMMDRYNVLRMKKENPND